jgi:hypothetical protein
MTLPEIPKEESKEQTKTKCSFCGKEGAGKAHERFCSSNPNNVRAKKKAAMKQETILNAPTTPHSAPAEPLLVISNVQPYIGDDVAWFDGIDGKFSAEINYIGIVNNIPMVLVQFNGGAIIPPASIPGFVGVLPRDSDFMGDGIAQDDTEPFPPFPEEEEEKQTEVKAQLLDEKISFTPECKPTEKPKKSWWPFSHKKVAKPETPKPYTTEIKELVEGAINATG